MASPSPLHSSSNAETTSLTDVDIPSDPLPSNLNDVAREDPEKPKESAGATTSLEEGVPEKVERDKDGVAHRTESFWSD